MGDRNGGFAPDAPGEYVDLESIYGTYGSYEPHVTEEIDYASEQGLPPVGGPHWGTAPCPAEPRSAPDFCGPVLWGIYRESWPAASLLHNVEHGGVVIWYNTSDEVALDGLESLVLDLLNDRRLVVLVPYEDMEREQISLTAWSYRDTFPVAGWSEERILKFIDFHEKRFNPEGL